MDDTRNFRFKVPAGNETWKVKRPRRNVKTQTICYTR